MARPKATGTTKHPQIDIGQRSFERLQRLKERTEVSKYGVSSVSVMVRQFILSLTANLLRQMPSPSKCTMWSIQSNACSWRLQAIPMSDPNQLYKSFAHQVLPNDRKVVGNSSENEGSHKFGLAPEIELLGKRAVAASPTSTGFELAPEIQLSDKLTDSKLRQKVEAERRHLHVGKGGASDNVDILPVSRVWLTRIRANHELAARRLIVFASVSSMMLAIVFWTRSDVDEPRSLVSAPSTWLGSSYLKIEGRSADESVQKRKTSAAPVTDIASSEPKQAARLEQEAPSIHVAQLPATGDRRTLVDHRAGSSSSKAREAGALGVPDPLKREIAANPHALQPGHQTALAVTPRQSASLGNLGLDLVGNAAPDGPYHTPKLKPRDVGATKSAFLRPVMTPREDPRLGDQVTTPELQAVLDQDLATLGGAIASQMIISGVAYGELDQDGRGDAVVFLTHQADPRAVRHLVLAYLGGGETYVLADVEILAALQASAARKFEITIIDGVVRIQTCCGDRREALILKLRDRELQFASGRYD
jgi:hypothetical protein